MMAVYRKNDNRIKKGRKKENILFQMPVALTLLVSTIGVIITIILCKPLICVDALNYCKNALADNVMLLNGEYWLGKLADRESTAEDADSATATEEVSKQESGVDETETSMQDTTQPVNDETIEPSGTEKTDANSDSDGSDTVSSDADFDTASEAENETEEENVYYIPKVIYEEYTPQQIDSRYYSDPGKIPFSMDMEYVEVDDDYFADSCWVGDSRTLGIADYCGWTDADFYCENGYCAYSFSIGKAVPLQGKSTKATLEEAMDARQYGKVYIMLGVNDTGYGNTELFKENYQAMIDMILEKQQNCIIYLVSNLHISKEADSKARNGVLTNLNINDKNVAISELADGVKTFYIDFNKDFTDDNGYLIDEKTFDGYHLYADGYMELIQFFKEHAVNPPTADMEIRERQESPVS